MKLRKQNTQLNMPTSRIFATVRDSGDFYSDTEFDDARLALWDKPPPYDIHLHTLYPNTTDLADAIIGYRMRMQQQFETARIQQYNTLPLSTFKAELFTTLVADLGRWEELGKILSDPALGVGCRRFGKQWRKWLAKRVVELCEDLRAAEEGNDAFLCLYLKRWT